LAGFMAEWAIAFRGSSDYHGWSADSCVAHPTTFKPHASVYRIGRGRTPIMAGLTRFRIFPVRAVTTCRRSAQKRCFATTCIRHISAPWTKRGSFMPRGLEKTGTAPAASSLGAGPQLRGRHRVGPRQWSWTPARIGRGGAAPKSGFLRFHPRGSGR